MSNHRSLITILLGIVFLVLTGCESDAEYTYSRYKAFFRFSPVTAAPSSLYPALNNPGEWCYVTLGGSYYNFKSSTGKTDTYPKTAIEQYGTTVWFNGLLVGTPMVPEINGLFAPICYDLICPNCYENGGIKRSIRITDTALGHAICDRCKRVYDLHNSGIVIDGFSEGSTNVKLYRYHCQYGNDTFVVQN